MKNKQDDTFALYDLRVETILKGENLSCGHKIGEYFEVRGENIVFPEKNSFSMYALAALLPLLPAKQRETDPFDWMTTDSEIACPDPNCGAVFRITRIGRQVYSHAECTAVPMPKIRENSGDNGNE